MVMVIKMVIKMNGTNGTNGNGSNGNGGNGNGTGNGS